MKWGQAGIDHVSILCRASKRVSVEGFVRRSGNDSTGSPHVNPQYVQVYNVGCGDRH